MSRIGEEPEDISDIVLEDFRFRDGDSGSAEEAARLHAACVEQGSGTVPNEIPWAFPGDFSVMAETGHGEFSGYICANCQNDTLCIYAIEVKSEYRGMGLGEALLTRLLEKVKEKTMRRIRIDLPSNAEGFSRVLLRSGFQVESVRYSL